MWKQPWISGRYYGSREQVDHHDQRYQCVNPRWMGEPQQEPSLIPRPPILACAGFSNGMPIMRDLANGQWVHVGPSGVPFSHEKGPNTHPNIVKNEIKSIFQCGDASISRLVCDYLWPSTPWMVALELDYCEKIPSLQVKNDKKHNLETTSSTFVSTRVKKNPRSIGSYFITMLPAPMLSFGECGSYDVGLIRYRIHVINVACNIWRTGNTDSGMIIKKSGQYSKPTHFIIEWENEFTRSNKSWLMGHTNLVMDGKLRVNGFCLNIE